MKARSHKSSKDEHHPLQGHGLKYVKDWSISDFQGRHHIAYYSNKDFPVSGTQHNAEINHIKDKAADVKRFEDAIDAYGYRRRAKLIIKDKMSKISSDVEMGLRVGVPMQKITDTIDKKQTVLHNTRVCGDAKHEINRFYNSVCKGRYHYVGYAMTAGFESIDYQDPETGDTGLHVAVRNCDLLTVEELLKYKANPELKNNIGNYPIHDAWWFHNTNPVGRSKEERIDQENKTCEIIHKIFSYGGYPNVQDQSGNSPLHIAVRYGHLRAVLLILGFQANYCVLNEDGDSPIVLAQKFHRHEILGILNGWVYIKTACVHADFTTLWKKFFEDYYQSMITTATAEAVLFDLDMESNNKALERNNTSAYPIDDSLLREAYQRTKQQRITKVPLPWETDWKFFKSYCEEHQIFDKLSKMQNVDRDGYYKEGMVKKKKEIMEEIENDDELKVAQLAHLDPFRPNTASRPYSRQDYCRGSSTSDLPEKKVKIKQSATAAVEGGGTSDTNVDRDGNGDARNVSRSNQAVARPMSSTQERRLHVAKVVGLDGKFNKFTKRPSTQSAILLPLRSAVAPYEGTEEEGNVRRILSSQGKEYDLVKTETSILNRTLGIKPKVSTDSIGAYCEELGHKELNGREALFQKLTGDRSALEDAELQVTKAAAKKLSDRLESIFKSKINLSSDGRRALYAEPDLLPQSTKLNVIQSLIKAKADEQERQRLKKATSHKEGSQQDLTEALGSEHAKTISADNSLSGEETTAINWQQRTTLKHLFAKPVVVYGKGRVTSTFAARQPLTHPWADVSTFYT